MKNFKYIIFLAIASTISIGCYEDIDNSTDPEIIIAPTQVYIDTEIIGTITSENGNSIENYTLVINNMMHDIDGKQFHVSVEDVRKKGQTIHILKDGSQIGVSTTLLIENDINKVIIQTHGAYENQDIQLNTPLDLSDDLSLDFANTTFENASNNQARATFKAIDSNISLTDVGYNELNQLLAIQSLGGFYFQLEDEEGTPLSIAQKSALTLNFDNIHEQVDGLFWLNPETENWRLVTDIDLNGTVELTNQGYYTFGNYKNGVIVQGRITNDDKPVSYYQSRWETADFNKDFFSTNKAYYILLVPKNNEVDISKSQCELDQKTKIVTSELDIDNQNIQLSDTEIAENINLSIVDCDGNTLDDKLFLVSTATASTILTYEELSNITLAYCDYITITGLNLLGEPITDDIYINAQISNNLNHIIACNENTETSAGFISIKGEKKIYDGFEIDIADGKTTIRSKDESVKFIVKGTENRIYTNEEVNLYINDENFGEKGYFISCEESTLGCGIEQLRLERIEVDGALQYTITLTGEVWMQTINPSNANYFDLEGTIIIK